MTRGAVGASGWHSFASLWPTAHRSTTCYRMETGWFDSPVVIAIEGVGIRSISSAKEAGVVLEEQWPAERGRKHEIALKACQNVIEGYVAPVLCRRAFEAAARGAGVLLE